MMLVTLFTLSKKWTLVLFFEKQSFKGRDKSQSQVAGRKKITGKDNKAQSPSEHKGKGERCEEVPPIWFKM